MTRAEIPSNTESPRLLVVNTEANSVELRDASSMAPIARLPLRAMPHEAAVDPQSLTGYVCISYQDGFYNHYQKAARCVEVIDAGRMEHRSSIDLAPHWGPHGVALSPDLATAFITCESHGGELIALDLASATVVGSVPVGAHGPHWMALLPDGSKAFTANKEDPFVTVVDTASMTVVGRIDTPHGTEGIAAAPDGSRVYIGSQRSPVLYVVDAVENTVDAVIETEEPTGAVAVTPDGRLALFTNFNFPYWEDKPTARTGYFQVLDTKTLELGPRVAVGLFPLNVTASADSATAYVANYMSNSVSVIDLDTMELVATTPVGEGPHGLVHLAAPRSS